MIFCGVKELKFLLNVCEGLVMQFISLMYEISYLKTALNLSNYFVMYKLNLVSWILKKPREFFFIVKFPTGHKKFIKCTQYEKNHKKNSGTIVYLCSKNSKELSNLCRMPKCCIISLNGTTTINLTRQESLLSQEWIIFRTWMGNDELTQMNILIELF